MRDLVLRGMPVADHAKKNGIEYQRCEIWKLATCLLATCMCLSLKLRPLAGVKTRMGDRASYPVSMTFFVFFFSVSFLFLEEN